MNKQEMQEKAKAATAKAKDSLSKMTSSLPPEVKERVSNTKTWLRFVLVVVLFTVISLFLFRLLLWVTGILILVQFLFMLFTGGTNPALNTINRGLARYVGQVWEYLLFCSDRFPIPDWIRNFSTSGSNNQPTPPPVQPQSTPSAAVTSADPADVDIQDTRQDSADGQNRGI